MLLLAGAVRITYHSYYTRHKCSQSPQHLSVDVARGFQAFVVEDSPHSSAFRYFVNAEKPTFMAKMVIYVTQNLLGDTVMVRF